VENSVGLMTMAGKMPEVLTTPVSDQSKFMAHMHGIKPGGIINFKNAIAVAQLALKHR